MKKIFQAFIISTLFLSCGGLLSKNQIKLGSVKIKSGYKGRKKWDDSLKLKRVSYLQGASLLYDILLVKMDKKSPFMNWFSKTEKDFIYSCDTFLLSMVYSHLSKKLPRPLFRNELEKQGFKEYVVNEFANNVEVHPAISAYNTHGYKTLGYCHRSSKKQITLAFPGFEALDIKI